MCLFALIGRQQRVSSGRSLGPARLYIYSTEEEKSSVVWFNTVSSVHVSVCPTALVVYQLQSFLRSVRTLRPKLAFQGLTKLFMLTRRRPCFRSEWPATRYSTPDEGRAQTQSCFRYLDPEDWLCLSTVGIYLEINISSH